MKNILKKNQVIITALAIMIAVAGYLNFTQDKVDEGITAQLVKDDTQGDTVETSGEVVENDISATKLPDSKSTEETEKKTDVSDASLEGEEVAKVGVEDNGELASKDSNGEAVGEAVLANNTIGNDFFASAKLSREQTRAKNKEMLMEIVDNKNISEKQKQDAINNILALTEASEMENAAETLLSAKGFNDSVVSIVEGKVDVVVNSDGLTEQQMAQIQDIVKRKTGVAAENIVINPVSVKEGK